MIDLGGMYGAEQASVNLDTHSARSSLVIGQDYEVQLLHAERRHWGSHLRMERSQFCLLPE